jgi:hypothetical protein
MTIRTLTPYENKIIDFMTRHGRHYADRMHALEASWDEVHAEAGRYGQFCEFTQAKLREIEAYRDEVVSDAVERYEDWASD